MWVRKRWGGLLLLCGTVGVATASGCSDTVDTRPGDGGSGASGQGGSSGSAGSSGASGASGAGRGGSAGSAGSDGSATGGTSGTGDGGIVFRCTPVLDEDPCVECVQQNCCAEFEACGSDPDCSSGNEYVCMLRCVRRKVAEGGVADDDAFTTCAGECIASGSTISDFTSDLIGCVRFGEHPDAASGADCLVECTEPADAS
jgi:hypothetical protein